MLGRGDNHIDEGINAGSSVSRIGFQKEWIRPAGWAKGSSLATRSCRLLFAIVRLDLELTLLPPWMRARQMKPEDVGEHGSKPRGRGRPPKSRR